MANLIRLKQIESGSYLNTAATLGQDFSQSVVNIITSEIVGVLPDGIVSSSVQIDITQTTNFEGFSSSISNSFADVYIELASITGSLETGLSASVATSLSASDARITSLELFSSSLDNGFATDLELQQTSSMIIDQGEW